jgi:hypothetical protein
MRRWLAMKLWPEFERKERRFWYLWHQIDDVNKWCDGEACDAAQWLLDQDSNYAGPLDVSMARMRTTPWNISGFRDWIYKRRTQSLSPPEVDSIQAAIDADNGGQP